VPSRRVAGERRGSLEALGEGPKYFEELMAALGSRDGRDIVRALEAMESGGRVERDDEGRYILKRV
jgi:DNA-binding HxlR family transcriptional regulator